MKGEEPRRDLLEELRRRRQAETPPEPPPVLEELARRRLEPAGGAHPEGSGLESLRARHREREGAAPEREPEELLPGLVPRGGTAIREVGLPLVQDGGPAPGRRRWSVGLAALLLVLVGLLGWGLASGPAIRPSPEAELVDRFHALSVREGRFEEALGLLHAFDQDSVRRTAPRLREMLARLPAGVSRLEFCGPPRTLRPGFVQLDVREIFQTSRGVRRCELALVLQRSEEGVRLHAHLSSPLVRQDLDRLPQAPDDYFSTPLQAVLNTCHLAPDEASWWRLVPRLGRLG